MKNILVKILIAVLCMGMITGCGSNKTEKEENKQEEQVTEDVEKAGKSEAEIPTEDIQSEALKAVYLTDGQGNEIYVAVENEMPFYSTVPEDNLFDGEEKITKEDLKNGDVIEIYGNGAMAQSYPAQYHGVDKMVRVEKENKELAEKYQMYMAQFSFVKDADEIPFLNLDYKTPDAWVTVAVLSYGEIQWLDDEALVKGLDGRLPKGEVMDAKISENTEFTLLFDVKPDEVTMEKWEMSAKDAVLSKEAKAGTQIETKENAEGNLTAVVEPDFIYKVTGHWGERYVEYIFVTGE